MEHDHAGPLLKHADLPDMIEDGRRQEFGELTLALPFSHDGAEASVTLAAGRVGHQGGHPKLNGKVHGHQFTARPSQ